MSVADALVKALCNTLITTIEKELYQLYELTQDEITFIESQQSQ